MKKQSGLSAVLTLFIITAVMALLLGVINDITAGPIAEATARKTERALQGVLAEGVTLGDEIADFTDETGLVQMAYATSDGYVFQVAPSGYAGEIVMMVGISSQLEVTGVEIISHGETSGLGANAATGSTGEAFRGQFVGLSGTLAVTKDGGTIDALTGATVTSRAMTNGVNAALACAATLEGGAK